MSGSQLTSRAYRVQAYVLAPLSIALAIAAVAAWIWLDSLLAIALGGVAIALAVSALRSSQASRLMAGIDEFIDHRESVLAQLGGRMESERGKRSVLLVLTQQHFYVFELHLIPQAPVTRLAYANLLVVKMNAPKAPSILLIELPDQMIAIYGLQLAELTTFERVLEERRPGLITGSLADELRENQSD